MIRKIFKTGNSMVVSLPAEVTDRLGVRAGAEVTVEIDDHEGVIIIRPVKRSDRTITPEFARMVDAFIEEYRSVLEALA